VRIRKSRKKRRKSLWKSRELAIRIPAHHLRRRAGNLALMGLIRIVLDLVKK
jgi:hypothetical protein